jgi:hypothetical protein
MLQLMLVGAHNALHTVHWTVQTVKWTLGGPIDSIPQLSLPLPLPLLLPLQTSVAEVLAAMIPCARLYGFLGCQLAAATRGQPRHTYSEWVDTYSGAEYLVRPHPLK